MPRYVATAVVCLYLMFCLMCASVTFCVCADVCIVFVDVTCISLFILCILQESGVGG